MARRDDVHLHLLIHGMSGYPSHLNEVVHHFQERLKSSSSEDGLAEVDMLVSTSNVEDHTLDGVDWGAERVLDELDQRIRSIEGQGKRVSQFSVTGYSLGGLLARYVVGILYHRKFFETVEPLNFTTFTTPHVGLAPYPISSSIVFWFGSRLLGRTGSQLYCVDSWSSTGMPLLEVMSRKGFIFHDALAKFAQVNVYANAVNDVTVPYYTGAFEEQDPFTGHSDVEILPEYDEGYAPVLRSFSFVKPPPWSLSRLKPLNFDGPGVEWVFPFSLILYLSLPIVILITILYIPLYQFKSKRSNLRILATGEAFSSSSGLITALPDSLHGLVASTVAAAANTVDDAISDTDTEMAKSEPQSPEIMSAKQLSIIRALNVLPHVRKYTVFIPSVRNSHAIIICRNPRFANHQQGRGVLRHWAHNFIL